MSKPYFTVGLEYRDELPVTTVGRSKIVFLTKAMKILNIQKGDIVVVSVIDGKIEIEPKKGVLYSTSPVLASKKPQ